MPGTSQTNGMQFVNCIVQSITGNQFQAAIYNDGTDPQIWRKWTKQIGEMTFTLAPYSLRGNGQPPQPGDKLIVGGFGDDTDHVVWRVTNLGSSG